MHGPLLLAVMALQLGAGSVPLAEAEQALVEGRFENLRERSLAALESPLAPTDEVRALELLATAEAAFGREAEAVLAFRRLLAVDGDYRATRDTSPKIVSLLERAREEGPWTVAPPVTPSTQPAWAQPLSTPLATTSGSGPGVERGSLLQQWWFWTATGVAVLGAGAVGWQLARRELPPAGSLGREPLR